MIQQLLFIAFVISLSVVSVKSEYFAIHNMADFEHFNQSVICDGAPMNEVDLFCDLDFNSYNDFIPICNKNTFSGTFRGHNYTIKNLVIKRDDGKASSDAGFFFSLSNANVSDLNFDETCYFHGSWAGALAAKTQSSAVNIKNVNNSGRVIGVGAAGGIIGCLWSGNSKHAIFESCNNDGNISVMNNDSSVVYECSCGGIVGYSKSNITFINCINSGSIVTHMQYRTTQTYGSNAGGIIGQFNNKIFNLIIESCSNYGSVSSYVDINAKAYNKTSSSGGIVGSVFNSSKVEMNNCKNYGNITSYSDDSIFPVIASGIIGYVNGTNNNMNVDNCYNDGTVNASSKYNNVTVVSTGIVYQNNNQNNMDVTNCINEGNIESDKESYGIVNEAYSLKNVTNIGKVKGKNKIYGISKNVDNIEMVINIGNVECSNNKDDECICGINEINNNNKEGLIYKETHNCKQNGGKKIIYDENGMMMVMMNESEDNEYISDILNNDIIMNTIDDMLWSRNMKHGYRLNIKLCGIMLNNNMSDAVREYIVVIPEENIKSSIERECGIINEIMNNTEHIVKMNDEEINIENETIDNNNNTIIIQELKGCAIYSCDKNIFEDRTHMPCSPESCHICTCNTSTGQYEYSKAWYNQTNECIQYGCDNDGGLLSWSICTSSNDITRICLNGVKCIVNKTIPNNNVYIEIETNYGYQLNDFNASVLLEEIEEKFGIESDEIIIGYETNEEGYIVHIILYVEDEETANIIITAFNDMDKTNCVNGTFCNTKTATVVEVERYVSVATNVNIMIYSFMLMIIVIFEAFNMDDV